MYACAIGFLTGILALQLCKTLPPLMWLVYAGILWLLLAWVSPRSLRWLVCCILFAIGGFAYGMFSAQRILSWNLPEGLEDKAVTVTGKIISLPQTQEKAANFEFQLQTLEGRAQRTKLRLSWYKVPANMLLPVGSHWQFQVRLKKPHGLSNPGGFDYEKWLFAKGIRATGYILSATPLAAVDKFSLGTLNDQIRQSLQQKIQQTLGNEPGAGLITALIMGSQSGISEQQWQVMRATGTNHLMAIAGVHIGFVAGFVYVLVNFLWRCSSRCLLLVPAQSAAAGGSLLAAATYSALAGFALPTERALFMLLVLMLGLWLRRQLSVWNAFMLALLIVLVLNPFATLTVSFWLSFGAVFAILYGIGGRLNPKGWWWKYARVQWVITLGLIPISLVLFQQTSLISFVANMFAVPAVGIIVLPLCLSGALLLFIWPKAAHWFLLVSAKIISAIWWLLAHLAQLPGAIWQQNIPNFWILFAAVIGVIMMVAPRGIPCRWTGILWVFPLLYYRSPTPQLGETWITLLDVGQGLSAVVRTEHHTLVYDTGPQMGIDDAGSRVILPFLHAVGVRHLDMLMISHGDSDHIGGANSLLAQMPAGQIVSSVPERFPEAKAQVCQPNQTWDWDGVVFKVLYPPLALLHQNNNSSCVLSISRLGKRILILTGDIEKPAEDYMLQHDSSELPTMIIIAPHHGSRTSSTADFVRVIHARYVLFPVGYKNRYHFPSQVVMERYQQSGAVLLNTASEGAITLQLNKEAEFIRVLTQRRQSKSIWN